jgi:hypothetical protein
MRGNDIMSGEKKDDKLIVGKENIYLTQVHGTDTNNIFVDTALIL